MNELAFFDSLFNNSMDDVFGLNYRNGGVPKVDVKETDSTYELEMELPGKNEADVDIELNKSTLTIASKKVEDAKEKSDKNDKNAVKYLVRERRVLSFSRSFSLPEDVDGENIKATFKNGILTVSMPRKQPSSPKRIAIKNAE